MPRPDPYVPRNPNDLLRSTDWNEIQVRTREDVQNHNHTGGEQGMLIGRAAIALNAIDGARVDPASTLTVTGLSVSGTFKVGARTLISEVDSLLTRVASLETRATNLETRATNLEGRATSLETRATTLETRATGLDGRATTLETRATTLEGSRVLRAGDTMTGALRTPGVGLGVGTESLIMPLTIRGSDTNENLMAFQNRAGAIKWHINQNFNNVSGLNISETNQADGRLFIKAGGNVGISTVDPKQRLHVEGAALATQGIISNGIVAGRSGITATYEYAYESIGVTESNMNLRLQSPNSVAIHTFKGETIISKWLGGTGHLNVDGLIKGPVSRPVREQLVHSRIIYGYAGDSYFNFDPTWRALRGAGLVYGPFSYAVPGVQSGARRRFRIYAIYTDSMNMGDQRVEVRFDLIETVNGVDVVRASPTFTLNNTWGSGSNALDARDDYSTNWVDGPQMLHHARVYIRTTQPGTSGTLRHLTLQTWDFFE
jgi:hypothetical protein